jgi:hypothetical protein
VATNTSATNPTNQGNVNVIITIFLRTAKLQNNAELEKHFWRNHAICPINKGNSGKMRKV